MGQDATWRSTLAGHGLFGKSLAGQAEELTVYPSHSLGEAFRRYRRTDEWAAKHRARAKIGGAPGVASSRSSATTTRARSRSRSSPPWRKWIEESVSLREAHRAVKIWRALWKVSAALGYCIRDADPSLGVRNTAAARRSATWTEGEAARLFKCAWRVGYHALAAIIAITWDTQLSPGDVRTLRASQLRRDRPGRSSLPTAERLARQSAAR